MKIFRKVLFWLHLVAGLISGLSIAVMCFTGVTLSFEKQLVAWAESDARRVEVPADAKRLPLADLQAKVREAQPEARPSGFTLSSDPADAVAFTLGRDSAIYANPYTGEVRTPASSRMHDFLHTMEDWHRTLALSGDNRAVGKLINGVCNVAFFVLAVTGLYLWWPRAWSWRSVRAITLLNLRASGKARDFNWHNAIGLWSAPILIVLTLTAIPMSFRWGNTLLYRLAGEDAPTQQGPGGPPSTPARTFEITRPSADARPLSSDAIIALVQSAFPQWEQISLRSGSAQRGFGGGQGSGQGRGEGQGQRPRGEGAGQGERGEGRGFGNNGGERGAASAAPAARGPLPLTVTVRESGSWPRTATTTLTLNPFTGDVLQRETPADQSPGRQLRMWTRFLHTGEALGAIGQLLAGLASLGGCFLVYTGFALSYRRFFRKSAKPSPAT